MSALKRHSVGLLLAGMALIVGSCVPLGQTLWSAASVPVPRLALSLDEVPAELELAGDLTVVPVVVVEPYPLGANTGSTLSYSFSIRNATDGVLIDEKGAADLAAAVEGADGGPLNLRIRFRELTIPAGRWSVRFDAGSAAGMIQGVELRLLAPSPGVMPALMTTLVLAILGWLAASLGALQWIRAEAARPAAPTADAAGDGQARAWTVGCHLSALLGYILPFGHLLGPLAVWLSKRHTFPGVERAGRNALNFQLSITLYVLAGLLLSFFLIGVLVLFVVVVFQFAVVLHASLRAQRGLAVTYPFCIRFI